MSGRTQAITGYVGFPGGSVGKEETHVQTETCPGMRSHRNSREARAGGGGEAVWV